MLATRIIPVILNRSGKLVKGKRFAADRIVGNSMQAAKVHAMRGVDELMILDITATRERREPNYEAVWGLAEDCFSPLTVGGGINSILHVKNLLGVGADKVCIGSAHEQIPELSAEFGRQCITASLDVVANEPYEYTSDYAQYLEDIGTGEILLQNIHRDGTMEGYDLNLIKRVSEAVNIPVIASGGCGTPHHALEAIQAGASAVAIGAMFIFTDETPYSVSEYLNENGVTTRIH